MNVALYLRKSREEEQETREETLSRHERILTDYCERHGLTVICSISLLVVYNWQGGRKARFLNPESA